MDSREALQKLAAEAASGELIFPTHTYAALRVRMTLDDPEVHINTVATVVQAEPLLAARVVAIANSVAFNRSGHALADVRSAVIRLGVNLVRALATAVIMRQLTDAPMAPQYQALAARLWDHTVHVAALAYVLARRVSHCNPDVAMFAGIVHEVGGFYMLSRAGEFPVFVNDEIDPAWNDGGETKVGSAVLKALSGPEEISAAVQGLWRGEFALPATTLTDTLYLANCLTSIANPLQSASSVHYEEMHAVNEQVMADATLAAVIEESVEELDSLAAALKY
jgi:HD-like signal output (HDOD) protein